MGLILGLGRFPARANVDPLQYSCLESLARGAWWVTVHRVTKSRTWLKRLSMHTKVLKTIPGETQHSTEFYSWLWFITAKEYSAKSTKKKVYWGKVWRSQGQSPKGPFPGKSDKTCLKSPGSISDNTCKMLQTSEAHIRIIALGFYWAWSHRWHVSGSVIPNPEKSQEQVFSINYISFTNTFDTVNNSYQ